MTRPPPQRPPLTCALLDLDDTLYDCPAMQRHVADNIRSELAAPPHDDDDDVVVIPRTLVALTCASPPPLFPPH